MHKRLPSINGKVRVGSFHQALPPVILVGLLQKNCWYSKYSRLYSLSFCGIIKGRVHKSYFLLAAGNSAFNHGTPCYAVLREGMLIPMDFRHYSRQVALGVLFEGAEHEAYKRTEI